MTVFILVAMVGFLGGILCENIRKTAHLKMDADNHVTFIDGVPHQLIRYGDEVQPYAPPDLLISIKG